MQPQSQMNVLELMEFTDIKAKLATRDYSGVPRLLELARQYPGDVELQQLVRQYGPPPQPLPYQRVAPPPLSKQDAPTPKPQIYYQPQPPQRPATGIAKKYAGVPLWAWLVIVFGITLGIIAMVARNSTIYTTSTSSTRTAATAVIDYGKTTGTLGDLLYKDGYNLTVNSGVSTTTGFSSIGVPKTGNMLVAIDVTIDSTSTKSISVNPLYSKLIDNNGYAYTPYIFGKDPQLTSTDLSTGQKVRGWVTFDLAFQRLVVLKSNNWPLWDILLNFMADWEANMILGSQDNTIPPLLTGNK